MRFSFTLKAAAGEVGSATRARCWKHTGRTPVWRTRPGRWRWRSCAANAVSRDRAASGGQRDGRAGWVRPARNLTLSPFRHRRSDYQQLANFLTRFEEGNSLRWHFDSGSSSWIASDAASSLARVEASESADLNLVPGSQSPDDAVKYGGDDGVRFLHRQPNGLANLFSQIGPGHLVHRRRITKKIITVLPAGRTPVCRTGLFAVRRAQV